MHDDSIIKCKQCRGNRIYINFDQTHGKCMDCKLEFNTKENKHLSIKVGEYYLSASKQIVKIEYFSEVTNFFEASNGLDYNSKGHNIRDDSSEDLIAEIPKALHKEIIRIINEYHTNIDFKYLICKSYYK